MVIKSIGSIQYAPVESRRFNMNVYRGALNDVDPQKMISDILANHIDIAIIHIPAESQDAIASLANIGVPYLIADMLVYYRIDLKAYKPRQLKNKDLRFVEYLPAHFADMDDLIDQTFQNYQNHYTANPLMQCDLVEIYQEWVHAYVTDPEKNRIGWLVKLKDQFVGFATCVYATNEAEIILNGIIPSVSGRGVYSDLLRHILSAFKKMGLSDFKLSTQAKNYAVQKIWSREGFGIQKSFFTIHLNSLMGASQVKEKEMIVRFCVENSQGASGLKCIEDTGHLVQEIRFNNQLEEKKTRPEIMIPQLFSNYYLTEFPGCGTTIASNSDTFLKRLEIDQAYRLRISFPVINNQTGHYKSLAKIIDSNGDVCSFSYYDLFKAQS